MKYPQNLISIFILTVLIGIGYSFVTPERASAQNGDVCEITIEKSADPATGSPFTFSVTGDEVFEFTLSDPGDTTEVIVLVAEEEEITVTELVPPGWILDDIECTIPTGGTCGPVFCLDITEVENGLNFLCLDSSEVTCTFSNFAPTRAIPTMSQWGLIAMAGILVLVGIWGITRKKAEV